MNSFVINIPDTISTALAVICGHYGNGLERKIALEADGYDYDKVQACVNDLMEVFDKYGS